MSKKVVSAGGGIAGRALALTLHQIGGDCLVIETHREMKPIGVGINTQPNTIHELFELGIESEALDRVGGGVGACWAERQGGRCRGVFDDIDIVIPRPEREDFMTR